MKDFICAHGGCMSKLEGNKLNPMLTGAKRRAGYANQNQNEDAFDDCATVSLGTQQLLLTTDLNHPVGHDPYVAGQIAAYHAISDVYAMGGTPKFAVAQVVLAKNSPPNHGELYMAGLYSACSQDKVEIVGGHTIVSSEPIIGLTVIGHPSEDGIVFRKKSCVPGDKIWVSKPIGTALILRAYSNGLLPEEDYNEAIRIMLTSNKVALKLVDSGIHGLTDVTGFGLLGHLTEMLTNGQGARISVDAVPYLSGVHELPYLQMKTRFIDDNISYVRKAKKLFGKLDSAEKYALFDPQTNGALLAVAPDTSQAVLAENGFFCIGEIEGRETNEIHLSG